MNSNPRLTLEDFLNNQEKALEINQELDEEVYFAPEDQIPETVFMEEVSELDGELEDCNSMISKLINKTIY